MGSSGTGNWVDWSVLKVCASTLELGRCDLIGNLRMYCLWQRSKDNVYRLSVVCLALVNRLLKEEVSVS